MLQGLLKAFEHLIGINRKDNIHWCYQDLKADNVVVQLDSHGHIVGCKLIDFGIAKNIDLEDPAQYDLKYDDVRKLPSFIHDIAEGNIPENVSEFFKRYDLWEDNATTLLSDPIFGGGEHSEQCADDDISSDGEDLEPAEESNSMTETFEPLGYEVGKEYYENEPWMDKWIGDKISDHDTASMTSRTTRRLLGNSFTSPSGRLICSILIFLLLITGYILNKVVRCRKKPYQAESEQLSEIVVD